MDQRGAEPVFNLGKALDFMRVLWAVDHALQRTSKRMDRMLGVTGPQRLVIRVLGNNPGLSAGDVARVLKIHPSTLTGILGRLEQRRIVRRVADPRDARRALVSLTTLGVELNLERVGTVEDAVRGALEKLSGPQVGAAQQVLEALIAELEAELPVESSGKRAVPHELPEAGRTTGGSERLGSRRP